VADLVIRVEGGCHPHLFNCWISFTQYATGCPGRWSL